MDTYIARLNAAVKRKGTPALVGIDPRLQQLPEPLLRAARQRHPHDELARAASAFEEFACRVIDVISPLVAVVKPQSAFFEELGPHGTQALARVIATARRAGLLVICDAKRGDIGSTAEAYARGYLAGADPQAAPWGADALTVNPYLGADTLEPFVRVAGERGGGIYVLVRTSNPGAAAFQDLHDERGTVYSHVAATVETLAAAGPLTDNYGSIGAVVGATYPRELQELRESMPHVPLLVPGYGSQGAGAADVAAAFDAHGLGAVINSSRAINFAYRRSPYAEHYAPEHWEAAVQDATKQMIADLAEHTPAGVLQNSASSTPAPHD